MRPKTSLFTLGVIACAIIMQTLYLKALPGSAVRVYSTREVDDFNRQPDGNMRVAFDGDTFDYRIPLGLGNDERAEIQGIVKRSRQNSFETLLAIANWVRKKMRFGRHGSRRADLSQDAGTAAGLQPVNVERRGLCDLYARLFAAACQAVEIPARIVELNGHVVPEAFLHVSGRWVMLDPTLGYYLTAGALPLSVVEIIRAYRDDTAPVPAVFATVRGDDSLYSPADEGALRDIYLNGSTVVTSQHLERRQIIASIARNFTLPIAKLQYLDCNSEKMGRKESSLRTALFLSVVLFGVMTICAVAGAIPRPPSPSRSGRAGSADKTRSRVIAAILVVAGSVFIFLYRNELKLLFAGDPPVAERYEYSFHGVPPVHGDAIIEQVGFQRGTQGLHLKPSSSGRIVFAFRKDAGQGCLLRVWFYGDKGKERPNSIKISADGGSTFRQLAGSGNHVGAVFDLSEQVKDSKTIQISFEAENHAPYTAPVFDGMELVIGSGHRVKPALPSLPKAAGLLILASLLAAIFVSRHLTVQDKAVRTVLVLIVLLAAYLRWHELVRLSGTVLDEDARGYYTYAQKMSVAGEHGFYSADFEKREPLYILLVRLFFAVLGASATHLRLVSFTFSLLALYLAYRIGKEWFHPVVGLIAAFILAVHPYLIQLSARGLREEWFSFLLLVFVYYGYVKAEIKSRARVLASGIAAGAILLTRSECLSLIAMLLLLYPLFAPARWNYTMALTVLVMAISLYIPHQYSMYRKHGDPFYTANQYARFYANREFAGQPGFPTREEIAEKGMYAGPKMTPVAYFFGLHTPWQLISYNLIGFARIHLKMPFSFISGRGNAAAALYSTEMVRNNFRMEEVLSLLRRAGEMARAKWWANLMGLSVLITFFGGLVLIGHLRYWMLYVYLILFQMHTSFLAYLGLDERLSIHSYPLIALCCGFCIYGVYCRLRGAGTLPYGMHWRV